MKKTMNLLTKLTVCLALLGGQALRVQAQDHEPAAATSGWLFDHRVKIEVAVPNKFHRDAQTLIDPPQSYAYGEFFGNRIGDVIPIQVRVWVVKTPAGGARRVAVDFSALKAGRLTINADDDPDWVLAAPVALAPGDKPLTIKEASASIDDDSGNQVETQLIEIRVFVQTKRQPVPTNFWIEFLAAAALTPNGALDWQKATTPDFFLTMSPTADKAKKDMSMGNTSLEPQTPPVVLGTILVLAGGFLLLLPISVWLVKIVRHRCLRIEDLDPAERFWRLLSATVTRTKCDTGNALSKQDVLEIVAAIKEIFEIQRWTIADLHKKHPRLDHGFELYAVLEPLEHDVLERDQELTPARYRELLVQIEQLVPRP